ncbi:membrane protein [Chitinophaga cymbidii]|uniref:Membrane protein n=2 Tax=Chitinophaga cymbidii TaxID=1096750 RepID=A0A512RPI6_9BACT|nr:membrane protein [Chitinophaga cymbidii]
MNITNPLPQLSADEYYIRDEQTYQALGSLTEKNAYLWAEDVYGGETNFQGWNVPYSAIFYANNVLEGLDKMNRDLVDKNEWSEIYGSALFYRSYAYFDLVRNFSPAYDPASAGIHPGVPLKLKAAIDEVKQRATVQETYDQLIGDLQLASTLLSHVNRPMTNLNRPSRPATFALFARIYLDMGQYKLAELYADSTLTTYDRLIDYRSVDPHNINPFANLNSEIIFFSSQAAVYGFTTFPGLNNLQAIVDTNLIALYEAADLRLPIFYAEKSPREFYIKKGYSPAYPFTGLATDEVFLIKAECAIRNGDVSGGIKALNRLLENRYDASFEPLAITDPAEALGRVLQERRKELVWRSLRWQDLKRLNREGRNITIQRELNAQTYVLPSNDPRYVFPIPADEIALSGIQQNKR